MGSPAEERAGFGVALSDRVACAEGGSNTQVAERLSVNRKTVGKWRQRFVEDRLDGLHDEPRPGAPRSVGDDDVERVIVATLEQTPRHRLSRSGDRQLNSAIHLVAVTQVRMRDSAGRHYFDAKLAEGKTRNEALRCLKRRLAAHLWRS